MSGEDLFSVATTPRAKTPSQPASFFGVRQSRAASVVKLDIVERPCHVELVEAPLYLETEVIPTVLSAIEKLLKLVKAGEEPKDPINFLALVNYI